MARSDGPPKLPVKQLAILAVGRLSEPLAMTSILPYLPEMIEGFGIPKNDVGRWVGITSGIFASAQCISGLPWGRVSDRWGRKPTMISSLACTMFGFALWGLSTSLAMAISVRIFLGLSNGNAGIFRTIVAELVPWKEHQPVAFALMPMIWSVGSIFGPSIGGFFANPARKFPTAFGRVKFFHDFPYALPSFLVALLFFFSLMSIIFYLEETLDSKKNHPDWGLMMGKRINNAFSCRRTPKHDRTGALDREAAEDGPLLSPHEFSRITTSKPLQKSAPKPTQEHRFKDVFTTPTVNWLAAYFFLCTHSLSYDNVLPVFFHTPLEEHTPENTHLPFRFGGGFGMSSDQIGIIFTLYGVACGFGQFLIFPPICKAFGTLNCAKIGSIALPTLYLITPYVVLIPDTNIRWYGALAVMSLKGFATSISFPCATMLLTNSAPSMALLGTLNGLAVMVAGFGRGLGPAMAGATFTAGVSNSFILAPWLSLAILGILGAIPVFLMDEPDELQKSRDEAVAVAAATAEEEAPAEDAIRSSRLEQANHTPPPVESENATLFGQDDDRPKTYGTV